MDDVPRWAAKMFEIGILEYHPILDAYSSLEKAARSTALRVGVPAACVTTVATAKESGSFADEFPTAGGERRGVLLVGATRAYRYRWSEVATSESPGGLNLLAEDGYFSGPVRTLSPLLTRSLHAIGDALRPFLVFRSLIFSSASSSSRCSAKGGRAATRWASFAMLRMLPSIRTGRWPPNSDTPPSRLRRRVDRFREFAKLGPGDPCPVPQPGLSRLRLADRSDTGATKPSQVALRKAMRRWLRVVTSPDEPVDLPICGECSDLQTHPRLTWRALGWPTEPLLGRRTVTLSHVELVHDPRTGQIRLVEIGGRRFAPVYLGGTLPTPLWGPRYWGDRPRRPLRGPLAGSFADCRNHQWSRGHRPRAARPGRGRP